MVAPLTPDQARLAAIREALPALGAGIYLNTAAAGPLPADTARAMAEIGTVELTYGRAHVHDPLETDERVGEARAAVSAVLGADLEAVALTRGAHHGLAMALGAAGLRPGDHVIAGVVEARGGRSAGGDSATGGGTAQPAEAGARQAAAWPFGPVEDLGVRRDVVRIPPAADDDGIVAAFEDAWSPAIRLVVVPHVLAASGRLLPVARIADLAHGRGALIAVDGGCSAGAIRLFPDDLGADAVVLPAERWLLGPAGLGALWCGPRMLDRSRRLHPGGYADAMTAAPAAAYADPAPGALGAFTDGPWNRAAVVGMARSCGWLSMQVGLTWAWARSAELARRAAAALGAVPGVEVLTPLDAMATMVTFRIGGWTPAEALDELGSRVFAIAGLAGALDAIRISLGAFNSEEEVGRFIEGVALLAAHTPATIPPRRGLNVLQ